jgi:hypothetical protein
MDIYAGTVTHRAPAVTLRKGAATIGAFSSASWHLNGSVQEPQIRRRLQRPVALGDDRLIKCDESVMLSVGN